MALYLGIDTSNYTTSTALYNSETGEMKQSKRLLPVKKGELGLRQSDAVFHHTQQLSELFSSLMTDVNEEIKAIAVSSRPRPVDGSYMPCFSVGLNSAQMLATALNVPLYTFSHQEGHISAALFSADMTELFSKEFLAFHVSGGTTEGLLVKPNEFCGFDIELVAETLDLNAGQAVDRVGLMLDLQFPCGKELEKLALSFTENIKVKPCLKGANCCLSGVENICKKLLNEGKSKEYISAYCLKFIEETIFKMTEKLLEQYGDLPVVYAGGVMSNSIIQKNLKSKINCVFAKPEYSCDNSAGIAYLAYRKDIYDKS